MKISNGELTIRDAEKTDCGQLAEWWKDGSVMAHAGVPLGLGTTEKEIEEKIAGDTDDTGRRLIIEYKGRPIGETSYRMLDGNAAEIGIKICEPDYRDKGLGRVLLSMLIKELFSRGCAKIVLDTNLKNARAQHVYEKLGFRKVRINVDAWKDQLGVPQSSVDYELYPEAFVDFSE